MAQQVINIGLAANDGSGTPLRPVFDAINDNFTELYDDVQTLQGAIVTADSILRSSYSETCDGTVGQVIAFSSEFVTNYAIQIIDFEGIGIEITAHDEDGFTITSLSAGNFGYIAGIEV